MSGTQMVEFILVSVIAVLFCFLTIYCAVTKRKQKKMYERRIKVLEKELRYDDLTGILTRRSFISEAGAEIAANGVGTLLIFDINGFKKVNDTYGHIAGDELIKRYAARLEKTFGKENTGRLGGDEFVVFVKGECDKEKIASAVRKSGVISFTDKQTKVEITSCCGAALCRSCRDLFETLYDKADKALYRSKAEGVPVTYYTEEFEEKKE